MPHFVLWLSQYFAFILYSLFSCSLHSMVPLCDQRARWYILLSLILGQDERESVSHSVVSDSLQLYGLQPAKLLYRQEYSSWQLFPSPGDLPDPGIEPGSPPLQANSLLSEPQRQAVIWPPSNFKRVMIPLSPQLFYTLYTCPSDAYVWPDFGLSSTHFLNQTMSTCLTPHIPSLVREPSKEKPLSKCLLEKRRKKE